MGDTSALWHTTAPVARPQSLLVAGASRRS
jgi:hypothetical protein